MKKRFIVFIVGWAVALSAFSIKIPARAISVATNGFTQANIETLQKFAVWTESEVSSWSNPTNGITQAQADALYLGKGDVDGTTISTNASGEVEILDTGVDTAQLADNAVTDNKILDYTISLTKLAKVGAMGVLGNITVNTNRTVVEVPILDENAMGSDSAISLATQQSIKAYVDDSAPSSMQYSGTTVFSGTCSSTFADLNIATAASISAVKMIVFLNVEQTSGSEREIAFRENGVTAWDTNFERVDSGNGRNLFITTDSSGIIEWKMSAASTSVIKLLAYQAF